MQFAIITALIAVLNIYLKYLDDSIKRIDYDNLIILNHSELRYYYLKKLRKMENVFAYIFVIASLLLMLSDKLEEQNFTKYVLFWVCFLLATAIITYGFNRLATYYIHKQMHYKMDKSEIKPSILMLITPTVSIGIVLFYLYFTPILRINENTPEITITLLYLGYLIWVLLSLVMPTINILRIKDKGKGLTFVSPETKVIIHREEAVDRNINIEKENIYIDTTGCIWVFDRTDPAKTIDRFPINKSTYLTIGGMRIEDRVGETTYYLNHIRK